VEHLEESIIDKECAHLLIKESLSFQDEFKKKTTNNEIIYRNTKNELQKSLMNPKIPRICKTKRKNFNFYLYFVEKAKTNENKKDLNSSDFLENKSFHQITMIENNKKINTFETKEDFLKKIEIIEKKIRNLQKIIKDQERVEISRLVKEFDFHNYEGKYNASPFCMFSCLFGAEKALLILFRNGKIKKNKFL